MKEKPGSHHIKLVLVEVYIVYYKSTRDMGGLPPNLTGRKIRIFSREAMLLSLYETLDLVLRIIKFIYDVLSTLHRRRKRKKKISKK